MSQEHIVAKVDELEDGQRIIVEIAGREIGIFNIKGKFYALPNHCFHQGGPLCKGPITGTVIANSETDWKPQWIFDNEVVRCPWHWLEFHIPTGQCIGFPKRHLKMYEVKQVGSHLVITI